MQRPSRDIAGLNKGRLSSSREHDETFCQQKKKCAVMLRNETGRSNELGGGKKTALN